MVLALIGTFVVLTIDPLASLEGFDDDEELSEICMRMENKKFVAYVGKSQFLNLDVPYRSYVLGLLYHGLPSENDLADGEEPEMSIPVAPNTAQSTTRAPVEISLPLPWSDCYFSIFSSVEVRCPVVLTPDNLNPIYIVTTKEYVRVKRMMSNDHYRREELYEQKYHGQMAPSLHPPYRTVETFEPHDGSDADSSGFCSDSDDCDSSHCDHADDDDTDYDNSNYHSSDNSDCDHSEEDTSIGVLPATMPVVNVSYDLSTVDKFSDAKEFFKEVELLNKLREESRSRKLQNTQDAHRLEGGAGP